MKFSIVSTNHFIIEQNIKMFCIKITNDTVCVIYMTFLNIILNNSILRKILVRQFNIIIS